MKKKILSVILSIALLAGTVLIPSNEPMVVTALETEEKNTPETNTATEGENTASVESTPTLADESYFTYTVSNGKATITYVDSTISGDIIISDTLGGYPVVSIDDYSFDDCGSLTSIIIPNGVTSIGNSAFWKCTSLTSITIPDSVTSIGYEAFRNCTSLTSITIPSGLTSILDWAFEECTSLTSVTIYPR